MLPLALVCCVVLAIATWLSFGARPLTVKGMPRERAVDTKLLVVSGALYVPFLVLADMHRAILACAGVVIAFALLYRRVVARADWALIAVFVLMFVDLRLVASLDVTRALLERINLDVPAHLFLTGIAASQAMSNVPATIALQPFTRDAWLLAYAVNIGGFGVALGSLANIIALRLARMPRIWITFHAYSVPVLAIVAVIVYAGLSFFGVWDARPW
jgi:Na+/H+ antiporter NhaD/arsenite permease-like protein